ncbi:MAG: BACON domain-containing protein [Candidatus Cryptobacteroides sp.]
MKLSKYSMVAALGAFLTLAGCTQNEIEESRAILPGETEITLPLTAVEMPVSIYADGTWVADVTDEWLSIEPTSGTGCMDITLTVQANPGKETREAKIIVKGSSLMSDVEIVVKQKGDRFRDETPITVSQAVALEKGDILKLAESQVMAVSTNGFVVSDGTSNIFVQGKSSVKMGDMVTLTGDLDSLNAIKGIVLEQVTVGGNSEIVFPEPVDITALTDYKPGKVEYVKVNGTYVSSGEVKVNGKSVASLFNPASEYAKLKNHALEIKGYYVGISSKLGAVIPASYVDGGAILVSLPFVEDFSWVEPFVEQYKAKSGVVMGDSMKDNKEYGIGSSYNTKYCTGFEDAFNKTGLEALFPSSQTLYVCEGNYLKMSKTSNTNGLRLPAFDIAGKTDLRLTFDWGINLPDKVVLEVVLEGEGKVDGSNKFEPLPDKAGAWEWQSETVKITGADNSTRICIRPDKFTGKFVDGEKYRWFIDNIEVMSLSDAITAEVEIGGIENNLITFEGLAPQDVTFTVKSDADYKLSASADWIHLDVAEGLANQEQTVTVKCDESQLSTLRQAEIVVKSGLTTKRIAVVQSAAGQSLDPLISVICSKPTDNLLGEGDEFSVSVQANVEYKVSISDEWIKEVEAPATKASVEKSEHSFTLDVNMTGAARTGYVRFYNEISNVEAVVIVKQENFEPRVDVTLPRQLGYIPAEGATFTAQISSNIDFTVSSDAVTLPVTSAVAGEYEVNVSVAANSGVKRTVEVIFKNEKYAFTKTVSFTQLGTNVLFADNFNWLAPLEEAYSAANSGKVFGQSVEDNKTDGNAPNAYTVGGLKGGVFSNAFAGQGYVDLNPSAKVIYPQHYYLKMGKTGNATGLILPEINLSSTSDVEIEFNWACHRRVVSGVDETDPVDIVVEVKDGDNVVYTSETLKTTQPLGKMEWQNAKVTLPNVAPGQRISVHPVDMKPGSEVVTRWYIDNIVVVSK